jgi:hypothetical protein
MHDATVKLSNLMRTNLIRKSWKLPLILYCNCVLLYNKDQNSLTYICFLIKIILSIYFIQLEQVS